MDSKITVKLPDSLRRRAKSVAALRGETVSDIVRDALEAYIAEAMESAENDHTVGEVEGPPADAAPAYGHREVLREMAVREATVAEWKRAELLDNLRLLAEECGVDDWDGHGAPPLTEAVIDMSQRILESLPPSLPDPDLGAEPDGHITLEWYSSPRRLLSVSISPRGRLHYAALVGDDRRSGAMTFSDAFPDDLTALARRVMS